MEALEKRGLHLRGGKLGRIVVADGPAESIIEGLALPGVKSAKLDQEIELIQPKRRSKRNG